MDRDFRREGINADQSNALLKDTVANFLLNSTNYCIVLTKEVSVENENSERSKFLASLFAGTLNDKDLIRFSVISKNSLEAGGEQILSNSLRDKLAGVILYSMLERVEQSLEGSVAAMRGILVSEFPDINKAVLQNSYKEGVSELDVLLRILQQKHRIELAKIMKEKTDGGSKRCLDDFAFFKSMMTTVSKY